MREADTALAAEIDAECQSLRARYGEGKSSEVPGAADARTLYKALGIDPTKTRPSNEALLRRALKGEGLYRINTLVDALNLASLREQLPFGLYDLGRVRPPVTLRLGAAGEVVRRHPQGRGAGRRAAGAGRCGGAVRQPDLRLAAHLDHARRRPAAWPSPTRPPATRRRASTRCSTARPRPSSARAAARSCCAAACPEPLGSVTDPARAGAAYKMPR